MEGVIGNSHLQLKDCNFKLRWTQLSILVQIDWVKNWEYLPRVPTLMTAALVWAGCSTAVEALMTWTRRRWNETANFRHGEENPIGKRVPEPKFEAFRVTSFSIFVGILLRENEDARSCSCLLIFKGHPACLKIFKMRLLGPVTVSLTHQMLPRHLLNQIHDPKREDGKSKCFQQKNANN